MKKMEELDFPEGYAFSDNHVWVKAEGALLKLGISDYAQDQLGELVYIDLPPVGSHFEKGEEFGNVESVKAVNGLFIPLSANVVEINSGLEDNPAKINKSPYGDGWILKIKPDTGNYMQDLITASQYKSGLVCFLLIASQIIFC